MWAVVKITLCDARMNLHCSSSSRPTLCGIWYRVYTWFSVWWWGSLGDEIETSDLLRTDSFIQHNKGNNSQFASCASCRDMVCNQSTETQQLIIWFILPLRIKENYSSVYDSHWWSRTKICNYLWEGKVKNIILMGARATGFFIAIIISDSNNNGLSPYRLLQCCWGYASITQKHHNL